MLISGDVYEFVYKIAFYPTLRIGQTIERYAKYIGVKSIDVECIIPYKLSISERIKSRLLLNDVRDYVARLILDAIADRTNWKNPTKCAYETEDLNTAIFLAEMITHMVGGAWIIKSSEHKYYVWSKGYYHYVGV
jgi:hypothetical protein